MRVLVCGGRDYDDWSKFLDTMDQLPEHDPYCDLTIISGGAKGADFMARIWAKYHEQEYVEYPADWKKHGKAAGAIRNQQMLDEGKPDLVVAFPGGNGTKDMVSRVRKAGIEVIEVD
jgi:UDP-N-acetylmuramoylalanine-D-glutamate ligase